MLLAAGAALVLTAGAAQALETLGIAVTHDGERYTATATFIIDAPRASVYAVLTDYDNLHRISPQILKSERIGSTPDGAPLVQVTSRSCILFFCRTVETVEAVEESPPGAITTRVLPARSDLSFGETHWRLEERNGDTKLTWRTTFAPDFWVPWLIGPPAVEQVLKDQLTDGAAGIERLANRSTVSAPIEAAD